MSRRARHWLAPALLVLLLSLPAAAQVTDPDKVAVYFDSAYSVTEVQNAVVPHLATGYLVLHNPTETGGGLGGWECRIEIEGYQPLTSWSPAGSSVNYSAPPDFTVGYTAPLPVTGPEVLLGTFDMYIAEATPFQIELVPLRHAPSIEDAMAYIPWDDKEILTAMTTTTGVPVVANYNWQPWCELDRTVISFSSVPVGNQYFETLVVTNVGGGLLTVDPVITDSDRFWLGNSNLPAQLGEGESINLFIVFEPNDFEMQVGQLDAGTGCDPVTLVGQGRVAFTSYTIEPQSWHYGTVPVGSVNSRDFRIVNTGEVPIWFSPEENCPDFTVHAGSPRHLQPATAAVFSVAFEPQDVALYDCEVSLGPEIGSVHLEGLSVLASEFLELSQSTLDFGDLYLGESGRRELTVTNRGNATAYVIPRLHDPDSFFELVSPEEGTTVGITPGYSRLFVVDYLPTEAGHHADQLDFGGSSFMVPLYGSCADMDSVTLVEPRLLGFGGVVVGSSFSRSVTVTNTTEEPVYLEPGIDGFVVPFAITAGGSPGELPPGQTRNIIVTFHPLTSEVFTEIMDIGPSLPRVGLTGEGIYFYGRYMVEPPEVVFGLLPVGSDTEIDIRVSNRGSNPIDMDVYLEPATPPFTLTAGGSVGVIIPNSSALLRVRFQPTQPGHWAHVLRLGPGLDPVSVTGTAADDLPLCNVSTTFLEFPPTATGQSTVRTVTVTNTGSVPLVLDPTVSCETFYPLTGWVTLQAGESQEVSVAFGPTFVGTHECVLDLGFGHCEDVVLRGDAFSGAPVGTEEDLVGIYFDQDFSRIWINDVEALDEFTGYLVLKNPSLPEDISGWEAQLLFGQEISLTGTLLHGNGLNFSTAPEFTVGFGSPLPAIDEVLLATFTFTASAVPEDLPISLVPKKTPSIPDAMAVISLPDHDLRPMYPDTGGPIVAWVNYFDPSVGIDDPVDGPELPTAPQQTRLLPNVPNPFNPETAIHYEVARAGRVRISVYDVMGRRVASLLNEDRGVGADQVVWRGTDDRGRSLPSGAYYVRLETTGRVDTRKVMLLK